MSRSLHRRQVLASATCDDTWVSSRGNRSGSSLLRCITLVVSALVFSTLATGCGRSGNPESPPAPTVSGVPTTVSTEPAPQPSQAQPTSTQSPLAPESPVSTLATITVAQLPPEGRTTLRLIATNGPFPYRKDGVVFTNRERRLPTYAYGYYHEYTVVTPGSPDRGARRIVTGSAGERYYSADHYKTFKEVISGGAAS